jgi:serine/threonine-protein kinase
MSATLRATVNLRAVQKSLNQMSTDERIEFIRKNGDPKIAVKISSRSADSAPDSPALPSPIAENLLAERIRSFGFRVISDDAAPKQADFGINGEVRFKKLSTKLQASGLEIDKYVLTSWTVKAVDRQSGEDIYYNTKIPEKQAWNSEEQALQDVGRLVGDEFSKSFFLEYFHYPTEQVRLELSGLPPKVGASLLTEINGLGSVLSATLAREDGTTSVIDATLSSMAGSPADAVQSTILVPLNRKLGKNCLAVLPATGDALHITFDASCTDAATLARLETLPPAGLMDAAPLRRDDVVKNPDVLRKMTI